MNLESILIISFFIISILGTLLHFTHGWLKNGILLHIFSAINESTWEHMKMLVAPTIVVMVFQYLFLKNLYGNLFLGFLILLVVQVSAIPIFYQILLFLMKKVHFIFTIIIFYLAILSGLFIELYVLRTGIGFLSEEISLISTIIVVILFFLFTYYPPHFPLFKDPITGKYGDSVR